jgi:hypothetical protein
MVSIRNRTAFRMTAVVVGTLTIAAACGPGWHQPDQLPSPLHRRQQVRVWHQGEVERWHGVIVTADSVSGVHWRQSASCDSCRVTLPRAIVDSLQLGNPAAGFWKTLGLTFGVLSVIVVATCGWQARGCIGS